MIAFLRSIRQTRTRKNVTDAYDSAAREHARLAGESVRLAELASHYSALITTTDPSRHDPNLPPAEQAWHRYAGLQDCLQSVKGEQLRTAALQADAGLALSRHIDKYMEIHHG